MKFLKYFSIALFAVILLIAILFREQIYGVYALSTVQKVKAITIAEIESFNSENGIEYDGRIVRTKVEDVFSDLNFPKTYLFNANGQYMFQLGCFTATQINMKHACTQTQQKIGGSYDSLQTEMQGFERFNQEKSPVELQKADYYVLNYGATWMQEMGVWHQQLLTDQINKMSDSVKIQFININVDIDPSWGIDISELLAQSKAASNS